LRFLTGGFPTFTFSNRDSHEQTWGFELAMTLRMDEDWQVRAAYSLLRGSPELGSDLTSSPRNHLWVQSSLNLGYDLSLDLITRYADTIRSADASVIFGPRVVPSYFELDARIAWRPREQVEFYMTGRNLLNPTHLEFIGDVTGVVTAEIPREVYTGLTIRY
jgi:iron complex outermembrane receptor protein